MKNKSKIKSTQINVPMPIITTPISVPVPSVVDEKDSKHIMGRFEYELFKEEDNKVEKVVRVKRITVGKVDKWKFFEDTKCLFTMEATKFTTEERDYLRTPEGFMFLMDIAKKRSFDIMKIKEQLKAVLKK